MSQFIAQRLAQLCQCQYLSSSIVNSRLLCTAKNDALYQAKLLPSDTKSALEIRNMTQQWILTKPIIAINEQFYRVDPYCSVIVKELGMSSCDSVPSTEALSLLPEQNASFGKDIIELVGVIVAGILLVVVITMAVILVLCCVCRKKSKSYDIR